MQKQILISLVSFFFINFYGKNVTVKHTTENVTVHISCFSYREELNKGIVIGEYVKEMCKRYNYTDTVEIFLEMVPNKQTNYSFLPEKKIFFYIRNQVNLIYWKTSS